MTGTLPKEGKKLWEEVYQKAKKYYNGNEEMASKVAWAAIKKKYKKNPKTGKWEKRASTTSWRYDKYPTHYLLDRIKVATVTLKGIYNPDVEGFEDRLDWDGDIKELLYKAASNQELQRELARVDARLYKKFIGVKV